MIPISLYIHLPWCLKKCPYCDFNSHALKETIPESLYVRTLLSDLDSKKHFIQGREIISIFFGGGTPSLFSEHAIATILTGVLERVSLKPNAEVTLEANPGTQEYRSFIGLKDAGINRLSLGVQSFQAEKLKILGRVHNVEDIHKALEKIQSAKFYSFNIDLMHGLPNQTQADALYDLTQAIQYCPPHLSWYQLTIEPNTFFHHAPPTLPREETLWSIQTSGEALLEKHHYHHYEVSAFAKSGSVGQHNLNYWQFGDYLGIGAGAHSKITDFSSHTVSRMSNVRHPKDYLNPNGSYLKDSHVISTQELPFEFMLNQLRLVQPFRLSQFTERTFLSQDVLQPPLETLLKKQLLMLRGDTVTLTALGKRFLNDVVSAFMPEV